MYFFVNVEHPPTCFKENQKKIFSQKILSKVSALFWSAFFSWVDWTHIFSENFSQISEIRDFWQLYLLEKLAVCFWIKTIFFNNFYYGADINEFETLMLQNIKKSNILICRGFSMLLSVSIAKIRSEFRSRVQVELRIVKLL